MKTGKITLRSLTSRHFHYFGETLDGTAILTGVLSTLYKQDAKAIESILKHGKIAKDGETLTEVATPETILATLTALDVQRVKDLNGKAETKSFQDGYKKAKGEVLTAAETDLKTKYGVESDLTGQELIDHIVDEKVKAAGATGDDAIKKSLPYQQLEQRMKKELKELKEAGEAKLNEVESTYKKEGVFQSVGTKAIDLLTGLNPILPKNPAVAETYKRDFLNELKGYEYEEKDGKILVSKGGTLLEDEHGHTLSYEDHVKKIASNRFEFAVNNDGKNAGDKNDPNGKPKPVAYPAGVNKPKDIDELAALTGSDSKLTPEEKRVVVNEYRERGK